MHFLDSAHTTTPLRAAVATTLLSVAAVVSVWALLWTEIDAGTTGVDWPKFAVLTVALVICERVPATWIRFGPIGVVTPIWMFGFALLLLGSPSLAVAAAIFGATVHTLAAASSVGDTVHRVAGVALSLSAAGLLMYLLGVRDAITRFDVIPWDWAVAIALSGITVLLLNTFVAAVLLSVRRRVSLLALLRRGIAVRVTAEGAMLSLAPIWVIALDFSLALIPLLGITTVLVFRSTRQALERSHEAYHDALTGLVNRRAFLDALDDALGDTRTSVRSTVLIMDLNGFKEVNDRLGHQIGDALLVAFADRLEASLPANAQSARLGGDEFAVLLLSSASDTVVDELVAELHDRLSDPLDVDGFPVTVGVSIGLATAPDHGRTSRDLIHAADVAMYKAKRTRTPVERYDSCVKTPQRGRLNLLGDLGEALHRDHLQIHFQPQLRVTDGTVDTLEALVRWNHPVHGIISPNEFVGLAEQTDLIVPITDAVIRMSARALNTAGVRDVNLAVNVSVRSLQDPDFAPHVFALLERADFPPDRLELEVTERAIVTNAELSQLTIGRLRDAGVRIAIDDFGVGYSSFQTLRILDVDRVKIDRDFVQGLLTQPRDRLIVSSLVNLAHDLGLDVVAEGVESTSLWDAVAALECDVAQGYGIAVPMAFPELRGWLSQWQDVAIGSRDRHRRPHAHW